MNKFSFKSLLAILMAATISIGLASCKEDEVIANPSSVNFDGVGGTQTIQITSNTGWTVGGAPDWLTVFPTQGTDNGTITLTAKTNSGSPRNCILYVQAGEASTTVSVNQSGQDVTPPASIVGTWKYSDGYGYWLTLTFNAYGTGTLLEYEDGKYDSDSFSYTYANNYITFNYGVNDTENIQVISLTSTTLVLVMDHNEQWTFYKQ